MKILKRIWENEWFRIIFILPFPLWCLPLALVFNVSMELIIVADIIILYLAFSYNGSDK